jgi:Ca2+-binding EF-hand superfamily protein
MPSEQEAINVIPSNVDMNGIADAFNNPTQIFRMLDKNNDGRVTKEDLQLLLEQLGINGMAANILSKYIFKELDANNNGTIEASDLANAGNILWTLFEKKQNSSGY